MQTARKLKDGSLWTIRMGHLEDNLCKFTFYPSKHGRWVSIRMRELGLPSKQGWTLSPINMLDEILHWFSIERQDMARAEHLLKSSGSLESFSPDLADWVIPADCTHPNARGKVYDWRVAVNAHSAGDRTYKVPLHVFEPAGSKWKSSWFRTTFKQSKFPDFPTRQAICDRGIYVPYNGDMGTMLAANSLEFYLNLEFLQGVSKEELECSPPILMGHFLGPPFWPTKKGKRSAAIVFKEGKSKPRGIGNLTGKGKYEKYFTNAGWIMDSVKYFPKIEYTMPPHFAFDCGVVKSASVKGDFVVQTFDYKAFYRQILSHPSLWYLYVACTGSEGATYDLCSIFGNRISVGPAVGIADALIYIVHWLLMCRWNLPDDTSTWISHLLSMDLFSKTQKVWIERRAGVFKSPSAKSWKLLTVKNANIQWRRFWNLVPLCLSGFFDDSQSGSALNLANEVTAGFLQLNELGNVLMTLSKFRRHTEDGAEYLFDQTGLQWVLDTDISTDIQHPVIQGKQLNIQDGTIGDRPSMIRSTVNLSRALISMAESKKSRACPVSAGERVKGQWNYITESAKDLRSMLYALNSSLACAYQPGGREQNFRNKPKLKYRMAETAYQPEPSSSAWEWSKWGITKYFTLSFQAAYELQLLIQAYEGLESVAWIPRRSVVDLIHILWILNDSAGHSKLDSDRAGACWFFRNTFDAIPWVANRWKPGTLEKTNSTIQECSNGAANLELAAQYISSGRWANVQFIFECYDSQPTMFITRSAVSHKPGLQSVLQQRVRVVSKLNAQGIRVGILWNDRKKGQIPDHLSKFEINKAKAMLAQRLPGIPLEPEPIDNPFNIVNV